MKSKISILYVSYNSTDLIVMSIQSLLPFLNDFDFELLVWENGAVASENSFFKDHSVKYLSEGQNIGFGCGINRLSNYSSGNILLIINPDTIAVNIQFNKLIQRLMSGSIGLIGCHHFNSNDKHSVTILNEPSLRMVLEKLFFMNSISERNRINLETETDDVVAGIDAVNGSFMIILRDTFETAGKFDDQFFLYCEEIDLCRRIRNSGRQIAFSKTNIIRHFIGQSTPNSYFQLHNVFVSENKYVKKYYTKPYWILFRILNLTDKLVRWFINGLLGIFTLNTDLMKKSNGYLRVFLKNVIYDRYVYPN